MSDPNAPGESSETFISHLIELRARVIYAASAVIILTIVLAIWPGMSTLYTLIAKPLISTLPQGASMIATDVTGTFMVPLKVTLVTAFVLSLPWVLYQMWAFVAPGLYQHEKRLILPLIVSSTLLFFCGMAFAYYIFFPSVFKLFVGLTPIGVQMMTDIEKYLSFVLTMFIAFGITFETPVVVVTLHRAGIISIEKLKEIRGYVLVGAFVIAAIVTPPDVLSQFMLALPLYVLYEVGILACRFMGKRAEESSSASNADS